MKGSFHAEEKKAELKRWNIKPFPVDFTRPDEIDPAFFACRTLVITVPPSKGGKETYVSNLEKILQRAKDAGCVNVVFTSSTSVYPAGPETKTEASEITENTSRGNAMFAAEQAVLQAFPDTSLIVRFGGLIGPARKPARFLSGKTDLPGADCPVNFLTLEDAVRILTELINDQRFDKVYNLVCPWHPTKEEFYAFACGLAGIPAPHFDPSKRDEGFKKVSGEKVTAETRIEYLNTDWKGYLRSL